MGYKIYEDFYGFTIRDRDNNYMFETDTMEQANKIIKALEKQIPKKPIVTSKGEEEYSGCPVCNKFVFDDYCQCCGQAIDWE